MEKEEFEVLQQQALARMLEMSKKSRLPPLPHDMPPTPDFVKLSTKPSAQGEQKAITKPAPAQKVPPAGNEQLNIPLLGNLLNGSDSSLIIILLLLLWSDKSDKLLMAALAFILL